MSGIILCDDILKIIGKNIKKVREKYTLNYYIELSKNNEKYRGWKCFMKPYLSNTIPPTNRELTLNSIEQIGSDHFMVSDNNIPLTLRNKLKIINDNDYNEMISLKWIDHKCHFLLKNKNFWLIRSGKPIPRITVSVYGNNQLFVY